MKRRSQLARLESFAVSVRSLVDRDVSRLGGPCWRAIDLS